MTTNDTGKQKGLLGATGETVAGATIRSLHADTSRLTLDLDVGTVSYRATEGTGDVAALAAGRRIEA